MKKIYLCLAAFFISGVLLAACGKNADLMNRIDDREKNETNEKASKETNGQDIQSLETIHFPREYKNVIKNVTFDTVLVIPENLEQSQLKKSTAIVQMPDATKAIELFASGKKVLESDKNKGTGDNGTTYDTLYNTYEDGSAIYVDTNFGYSTPFEDKIRTVFRLDGELEPTESQFSKDKNFAFLNAEQAFFKIRESMNHIGYELSDCSYDYYALEHQVLEKQTLQKDDFKETETSKWNDQDDSYYFFGEQMHQGIPVYYGMRDFPQDDENQRPIQAIYSANGIEMLRLNALYRFQTGEEAVSLSDFETIATNVANKYGNLLTSAAYQVKRAKLYQIPVKSATGEYEVKIGWFLEIEESGFDKEMNTDYVFTLYTFVDAQTGEEIIL
ncbi:hypothetical protein LQZ18_12540 [Lachnospiraceae bacterium ZAX-1]